MIKPINFLGSYIKAGNTFINTDKIKTVQALGKNSSRILFDKANTSPYDPETQYYTDDNSIKVNKNAQQVVEKIIKAQDTTRIIDLYS